MLATQWNADRLRYTQPTVHKFHRCTFLHIKKVEAQVLTRIDIRRALHPYDNTFEVSCYTGPSFAAPRRCNTDLR